jgi:hypothetical protein
MKTTAAVLALAGGLLLWQPGTAGNTPKCWKCNGSDLTVITTFYVKRGPEKVQPVSSTRRLVRTLDGSDPRNRAARFAYSSGSYVCSTKKPVGTDMEPMLTRAGIQLGKRQKLLPGVKTIEAAKGVRLAVYRTERVRTHSYELAIIERRAYFCRKCGSMAGTHDVPRGKLQMIDTEWNYDYE